MYSVVRDRSRVCCDLPLGARRGSRGWRNMVRLAYTCTEASSKVTSTPINNCLVASDDDDDEEEADDDDGGSSLR